MDATGVDDVVDGVLAHYGVKGMKWGVRRSRKQLDAAASEDYLRTLPARSKPASSLSNDEMRDLINRMNLEKQYSQLFPAKTSVAKRGQKFATKLLVDVGSEQAKRVARAAATSKVDSIASKKGLDVQKQITKLKKK